MTIALRSRDAAAAGTRATGSFVIFEAEALVAGPDTDLPPGLAVLEQLLALRTTYLVPTPIPAPGASTSDATTPPGRGELDPVGTEPRCGPRRRLLGEAKRYIEDNLEDPDLTPEKIAGATFISLRYLHSLFKDEGISVSRYVQAQRLTRSLQWLADPHRSHLPIGDIASRLGFKDASHFARVFKASFHSTPREYRKRLPAGDVALAG